MEFFVFAFYSTALQLVIVMVFTRALKGVDRKFDKVVDRFVAGDADLRDARLECMVHVTVPSKGLSLRARATLQLLGLFLQSMEARRHVPQQGNTKMDRYPLPPVRLALLGETQHFGGGLQSDPTMPGNYVSSTLYSESVDSLDALHEWSL